MSDPDTIRDAMTREALELRARIRTLEDALRHIRQIAKDDHDDELVRFVDRVLALAAVETPCDGSPSCKAAVHAHGCFAEPVPFSANPEDYAP